MDKQFLQVVGFKLYFQVQNLCPVTCDVPLLKMIVALKIICPFYEQILRLYSFESAQVCLQSNLSTNNLTFLAKFTDINGQEVYQAGGLFFFFDQGKVFILFFFSWSSSVYWWYSDQQSSLSDQDKADLSRDPYVYLSGVPVWETKHYPLHHQGM